MPAVNMQVGNNAYSHIDLSVWSIYQEVSCTPRDEVNQTVPEHTKKTGRKACLSTYTVSILSEESDDCCSEHTDQGSTVYELQAEVGHFVAAVVMQAFDGTCNDADA